MRFLSELHEKGTPPLRTVLARAVKVEVMSSSIY